MLIGVNMSYMPRYSLRNPELVRGEIAQRAKELRLHRNLTQVQVAERADISHSSLQRFEASGAGSIETLVAIAFALNAEAPLELLFQAPKPSSIDEFLEDKTVRRKRARGSK